MNDKGGKLMIEQSVSRRLSSGLCLPLEGCVIDSKPPYVFASFKWLHLNNPLTAGPTGSLPLAV